MNIEKVRKHCLKKDAVTEGFPFGNDVLVFKVMNKMFCLVSLKLPIFINLKCEPELAVELRERHSAVTPGYHMDKIHWNSVQLDGTVPDKEILKWIDQSYELIVAGIPAKKRPKL
ncbi:MAG: MmcQ-like protein [Ignavibacteriae bacterium HGW-Ignavibacteriae-3]|nr:MAG: MmcQ-like protein [Ignavibacteriae bacterium HGW-Ignavibacteriae-3]